MESGERNPIKIFTWHIHGSYLYYLSQGNFQIYLPVDEERSEGYIGYGTTFPFGKNVHEVPLEAIANLSIDCILFQSPKNYLEDQYRTLTAKQRSVPKVYLEHDPPQGHPTNTKHWVIDSSVTIVHVTHFNNMMWDNNGCPARVISHGIHIPSVTYRGTIPRGIVVINNLKDRGRRLGVDIFLEARKHVPLDLIGMNTEHVGGLGEVLHPQLPEFIAQYRFFFNPIRYTSLGLAVLESMMVGLPVVGMATTELVTVVQNEVSGFIHTDLDYLISKMNVLIHDRELAERLGSAGRKVAIERFNINRFINDWENLLRTVITNAKAEASPTRKHYHLQSDYENENSIYK
jgi:glycosyltransferase involved in cell wall biosynthesis